MQRERMVRAISDEIRLRANYLPATPLQTIYWGGGTPSLLTKADLMQIFEVIHGQFEVLPNAEITLEANPDDLNGEKLRELHEVGINRLSIGIQSFDETHLKHLHRIHTSAEASDCVKKAQDMGIDNISIDLIYAIPAADHRIWHQDLQQALALSVPHISAYCLTIEPQTVFGNWLRKNKISPIDELFAAEQFEILTTTLLGAGFDHYEISNFGKPNQYSQHNSAYWKQKPYLGVGPSAHSFDGTTRQFNVSHNQHYMQAIEQKSIPAEIEVLTVKDRFNEYLLTGLRTSWGCSLADLENIAKQEVPLGIEQWYMLENKWIPQFSLKGWVSVEAGHLTLTQAGKLFADRIASEMFWV